MFKFLAFIGAIFTNTEAQKLQNHNDCYSYPKDRWEVVEQIVDPMGGTWSVYATGKTTKVAGAKGAEIVLTNPSNEIEQMAFIYDAQDPELVQKLFKQNISQFGNEVVITGDNEVAWITEDERLVAVKVSPPDVISIVYGCLVE